MSELYVRNINGKGVLCISIGKSVHEVVGVYKDGEWIKLFLFI